MRAEMKRFNLNLIVTRACPLACAYCHMSRRGAAMSREVWRRSVELLLREDGPLELQLMGGEPLVEYRLVREILVHARAQAARRGRDLRLGVTTNGLLLDPARSRELGELGCSVMLSLDGDEDVQTAQRAAAAGGKRHWPVLTRNLEGLARSGTPFFVNMVATPEYAGRLSRGAACLLDRGARSLQFSYALGRFWDEESLEGLERELRRACAVADAARPRAEIFNRGNGAEPVLISPQHVVDADGRLYVGCGIVLENLWPGLQAAFRAGRVDGIERLPGRRASPHDQLRRLRHAAADPAVRRTLLNNLAVGRRMRAFWTSEAARAGGRMAEAR